MSPLPPNLLSVLVDTALAAGEEIERIYAEGCETEEKEDGSPVTIADRHAEAIILERLGTAFPGIPVLAEEEAAAGRIPALGRTFFCVDPLDGTRGFVQRTGEFTVNIGLIEDKGAVAGVIYAPDSKRLYFGARGEGAWRAKGGGAPEPIRARPRPPAGGLVAVGSRSHASHGTAERSRHLGIANFVASSSSLKFCLVAEGTADLYPRYGTTAEWDTAAGQAILEAAGGRVIALDGTGAEAGPLAYGKIDRAFLNPHFIAWGA